MPSVTCSLPAVAGLAVTFDEFAVARDGTVSAASASGGTSDVDTLIGLGGVLPFRLDHVAVTFSDLSDLADFELQIDGGFDLAALGTMPFTPVIGIDGSTVTPTTSPADNHFAFAVRFVDGVPRRGFVGPVIGVGVGFGG